MNAFDLQQIADCFGRAEQSYDRSSELQFNVGAQLGERIAAHAVQIQTALDLGCGTGAFLSRLYRQFDPPLSVGLDIALPLLRQSSARNRGAFAVQANFQQLPFPADRFDLVTANMVLQWSPNLGHAFAEAERVLAPGGLLAISMPVEPSFSDFRQILDRASAPRLLNRFVHADEVRAALGRFRLVEWHVLRYDQQFSDVLALLRSFRKFGGHARTGDDRRPITRSELERIRRMTASDPVTLDWQIAIAVAIKGRGQ